MKIYLINLDRHPDRLAHMREQLNGVAFERISAVDGSNDSADHERPHSLRTGLPREPPDRLAPVPERPGGLAPASSRTTCTSGRDSRRSREAPRGYRRTPIPLSSTPICRRSNSEKSRSRSASRQIARLYSRHQSSAAYILTREGAARYLELTASASLPADYALVPQSPAPPRACASISSFPRSRSRITFLSRTRAARRSRPRWLRPTDPRRCVAPQRSRSSDARAFVSPARPRA